MVQYIQWSALQCTVGNHSAAPIICEVLCTNHQDIKHMHIWWLSPRAENKLYKFLKVLWQTFFSSAICLWNFLLKKFLKEKYPREVHNILFLRFTCWTWLKQPRNLVSKHFLKIWCVFGCNSKPFRENVKRRFNEIHCDQNIQCPKCFKWLKNFKKYIIQFWKQTDN